MNKRILLPLVAMLTALPAWASQQSAGSSLSLSTTALSFNGASGNISSQPLTVTVTGQWPVTIQSIAFSNSAFFGPAVSLPITLSSGQSLTGLVSAHPRSIPQSGIFKIVTNTGTYSVSLTETSITKAAVAHSVSLTWNPPSSSDDAVDSYQVNRAVSGSTQYSVIGTTTAASTAYSDTSVQPGQTYMYQVRAVDDQGRASGPSNAVTLTVP